MTRENSVYTLDRYIDLLKDLEQSTDSLALAIRDWDAETVTTLMEQRARLIAQVGQARKSAMESFGGQTTLRIAIETAETQERLITAKQLTCEAQLSKALEECRSSLISINQRKGLQNAYQQSMAGSYARFLDSSR